MCFECPVNPPIKTTMLIRSAIKSNPATGQISAAYGGTQHGMLASIGQLQIHGYKLYVFTPES
jgi:hypothetical protein